MAGYRKVLWVLGCYEKSQGNTALRLYLIGAVDEVEAHQKAGIILRKQPNLWFDSLERDTKYLEIYPAEQLLHEKTTITIYDRQYYGEL
jgi:hypothetical protein